MCLSYNSERNIQNFFGAYIAAIISLTLIFGLLVSLLIYSLPIFLSILCTLFIEISLAWIWRKKEIDPILFKALTGFLLFLNMGTISVIPLLYYSMGSILFWLLFIFCLLYFGFILKKRKMIAEGIRNPQQSNITKGFLVAMTTFMIIGGLAAGPPGQLGIIQYFLTDTGITIYIFSTFYIFGLIMLYISIIMLYPIDKEYEEQPRRRKKKSRAQRKKEALKQRYKNN